MPQQIIIGSDGRTEIIEVGPVGPPGRTGPPGPAGPQGPAGTGEGTGRRAGTIPVTLTTEVIEGNSYKVLDVSDNVPGGFNCDVTSAQGGRLLIDFGSLALADGDFNIFLNNYKNNIAVYLRINGSTLATLPMLWNLQSTQFVGCVPNGDGTAILYLDARPMDGELFGYPGETMWGVFPSAYVPGRAGAEVVTPVAIPSPDEGEPDCTVDLSGVHGTRSIYIIDLTGYTHPKFVVNLFELLSEFKIVLFNASGIATGGVTFADGTHTQYIDPATLSAIYGIEVDSGMYAMTALSSPDLGLGPQVNVSPTPTGVLTYLLGLIGGSPSGTYAKIIPPDGSTWIGTVSGDLEISCHDREVSVSFEDGYAGTITFGDINPGEYTEMQVMVYNGYGGGGGTIAPVVPSAQHGTGRLSSIGDGQMAYFNLLVWNDAGTIKSEWGYGHLVAAADVDYS